MSSLRNSIPSRAHKERSQPSARKKFGLLEKHKDYVQRAKAFHKKEDTLRKLREKAANRNEDEFYFKMKIERLTASLHSIDNQPANKHVLFAEDREEAKELQSRYSKSEIPFSIDHIPAGIKRKTDRSYKELEARKDRLSQIEKIYMDMAMKKELQKNGRKRKLTEDEIVCPTSQPVYKWRVERKR
ncbi:U3 small nucleolar RNA-associated protein 11 [Vigna unguiculata]|uniref:U3 small nucleolar RNA-associated protein 11 n=1 Tax=Vigna unguiculata TaxID=3917 RepID=A0A4D6LUU3_VIGUN|nr:U3 small nucleolar RNA-associated protein 11 [Vigna unguiculata]